MKRPRRESREWRRYRRRFRVIMARASGYRAKADIFLALLRGTPHPVNTLRNAMFDDHWRPRYPARRALDTLLEGGPPQ